MYGDEYLWDAVVVMHVAASPVWSVDRLEGAQWFLVSRLRLAPKGQLDWCI